ncbi:MAG: hypothetical protein ACREPA_11955, partial [Candidatus Dormibacteraceae bacterium]
PGFYGRCALGDAEARARWVAEVKTSRIKAVRRLSRELATALGPLGRRFWEAKGSQLKALSEGDDPTAPTRALDSAAAELQAAVEAFLEEHTQALNEIGMPLAATSQLVRSAVDTMLAQRSTESSFQITDDMLERFPPELRAFLRPRSAA